MLMNRPNLRNKRLTSSNVSIATRQGHHGPRLASKGVRKRPHTVIAECRRHAVSRHPDNNNKFDLTTAASRDKHLSLYRKGAGGVYVPRNVRFYLGASTNNEDANIISICLVVEESLSNAWNPTKESMTTRSI